MDGKASTDRTQTDRASHDMLFTLAFFRNLRSRYGRTSMNPLLTSIHQRNPLTSFLAL
uniref:Uncharacterized protein n=1 Tax=Picea sitchensis TaxID=3332 RepID=A0A6B9XRL2_PICSI|nr:hypothetical protein Q903MT_gene5830 [Picea sitchensis]